MMKLKTNQKQNKYENKTGKKEEKKGIIQMNSACEEGYNKTPPILVHS